MAAKSKLKPKQKPRSKAKSQQPRRRLERATGPVIEDPDKRAKITVKPANKTVKRVGKPVEVAAASGPIIVDPDSPA